MASCDSCGSTILFGGVRQGDRRFCNARCQSAGALMQISSSIPEGQVTEAIWRVHQGMCPKCQGPGPVDVYTSHSVWSALVITRWSSQPQLSCRSCGVKAQLGAAALSLVVGWWGFPWGLLLTPIQVIRNVAGILSPPDAYTPSPKLERQVRLSLGSQLAQQARASNPVW